MSLKFALITLIVVVIAPISGEGKSILLMDKVITEYQESYEVFLDEGFLPSSELGWCFPPDSWLIGHARIIASDERTFPSSEAWERTRFSGSDPRPYNGVV